MPISKNLKNGNSGFKQDEEGIVAGEEDSSDGPDGVLRRVDEYISKNVDVPNLSIDTSEFGDDILVSNVSNCTNEQLEEYLSLYGSYKSFLEAQLSRAEARRGLLRGMFEDTLSKEQYNLSLQYDKRQTKDFLRGEAMLNNKQLDELYGNLLEADALCVRIGGMKDSYSSAFATVSRVVSLRISGREQV